MQLNLLREQAERLANDRARALYAAHAGIDALHLRNVHRTHASLVSSERVQQVREAASASEGRRALRLQRLAAFLFEQLAEQGAAAAIDACDAELRTATVPDPDRPGALTLPLARIRLTTLDSRDARHRQEQAIIERIARSDRHRITRFEALRHTAERLGFDSAPEAIGELTGHDPRTFANDCRRFLSDTEGMYRDLLAWRLRRSTRVRPFPHGAERHDVLFAVNPAEFDGIFRPPPTTLETALVKLGLHPRADGRIRVDDDNRARRTPHALTLAIDPPGDVVLLHRHTGGFADTRGRLHALGVALHAANTAEERPFEDRLLGDRAVSEGFGAVFANLLLDRHFLDRVLQAKAPDLVRVLAFTVLTRARHDAASTIASLSLHEHGPGEAAREHYADTLSQSLLGRWPQALLLDEAEPSFESSTRLRGLALETVLHDELQARFDQDWWQNPRAGEWLAKLFSAGRFDDAEELSRRLPTERGETEKSPSLDALAGRLEALLD